MKPLNDPSLPGLATALDVEAFLALLRQALPECRDGIELLAGHVMDVRYQESGPCWLLYRLKVRGPRRRSQQQLLSAQLLRLGERPPELPAGLAQRFAATQGRVLSTPSAYVPAAHMVVYAFPVDGAMPALFDAADPNAMRRHLNRLWAHRGVRVREVRARPLGYTPQARAAFRYEVLSEETGTGVPELRRLIGKLHAKKAAHRLFSGSWALYQAAGRRLSLAPPVGYIPAAGLTLQEEVRGERLGGLASAPGFTKRVRQTARMVAVLHQLSVPLTTRRKPEDEALVVHRWAGVLAALRPDIARRVEALRDRLSSQLRTRTTLLGPVHGDFHHTNVLVHDDGVTIIDLDEMAYGDPMLDVGRFLASLRIPSLRAFGSLAGLAGAREAFLREYLKRAPGDERRVRLFEAASLVTSAASSFRIQRSAWEEEVVLLIEEAERILQGAAAVSVAAPASAACREAAAGAPPPAVSDPGRWARDGIYMQAALDPSVRKAYGAEISSCRVIAGASPESSERFRYLLRGRRRGAKWRTTVHGVFFWRAHGARGFLERLEALHRALVAREDAPLVPRPVAYLRPLALIVWELPAGTRFSSSLAAPDAVQSSKRIASALAALHSLPLRVQSRRTLAQEAESLRRKVLRLGELRPELLAHAQAVLRAIERPLCALPAREAPILRTVHPHHIVIGEAAGSERVGFTKIEDVALGHPGLDAGDFLARLRLLGIQRGRTAEAERTANAFRDGYAAAADPEAISPATLALFEAAALLRLACAQAKEGAKLAARLLEIAPTLLGGRRGK